MKRVFLGLVLLHGLLGAWFLTTGYRDVFREREIKGIQTFSIPEGSSLNEVLHRLHARKLAPAPFYTRIALVFNQTKVVVKKGTYRLPPRASTWQILSLFDQGRVLLRKFTIPEGLDKWQTAELLGQTKWGNFKTFLDLINDPSLICKYDSQASDLEGYLYPETYFFPDDVRPKEIVQTLVSQFLLETKTLRQELAIRQLSLREYVTFASLIEKESAIREERGYIASVFANRLKKGMLLQCDPTIIYSLKREKRFRGKIYKSDIKFSSPYNTYVSPGLPPGPIANPSKEALAAAMDPYQTPYYYFVAQKDGTHYFSETLREHNRAVARYRSSK